MPGFYPRANDPCSPVSATNPFADKGAIFQKQFSWRNGANGISFGSVAALHLVDAVLADNNMRGIEGVGADAEELGLTSVTKLRGPWGANRIVRPLFIGHSLQHCPACDGKWAPNFPKDGPEGWVDDAGQKLFVRLGIELPAWSGLLVENATFVNYDREGMYAVGGMAKAVPAEGAGYSMELNGGFEARFRGTKWEQADSRIRWRWDNEAHIIDEDGTFVQQPFCTEGCAGKPACGCSVLRNNFVTNQHAFPDCYRDGRFDGMVCKPTYRIVQAMFEPADPMMLFPTMQVSYRDDGGMWVREDDKAYLRNRWRPEGLYNLVEMDVSTDELRAKLIGHSDVAWQMSWLSASGHWLDRHTMELSFTYIDFFDGLKYTKTMVGEISADGSTLHWVNGTSRYYGSHQLATHVPWHRCELVPHKCAGETVRYANTRAAPISRYAPSLILPHHSWLKVPRTLCEDSARSARLVTPRAQPAPTDPGAQPELLESSQWPQKPASGRPKNEDFPL